MPSDLTQTPIDNRIRRLIIINEIHKFYAFAANEEEAVIMAMDAFKSIQFDRTMQRRIEKIEVVPTFAENVLEKSIFYQV